MVTFPTVPKWLPGYSLNPLDTMWLHILMAWARVQLRINLIGKKQEHYFQKSSIFMSKSVWLLFKPSWLARMLYWYHRGYGLNFGAVSLSFNRLSFHNCLSCVLNCDDLLTIPFEVYLINCIFTLLDTSLMFFNFLQIILSSLALWLIFFSMCMFVIESSKECWYTKSCRIYQNSKYAIQFF